MRKIAGVALCGALIVFAFSAWKAMQFTPPVPAPATFEQPAPPEPPIAKPNPKAKKKVIRKRPKPKHQAPRPRCDFFPDFLDDRCR